MRGKIDLRKERVELATVVARAVETVQTLIDVQGHQLEISLPPESLTLSADVVRLTQVLGNLLTNAAKYTDPGGKIRLFARREGESVAVCVRDTGIGIAPDMLPHVFELFVQADHASTKTQGGLGIGLTLVKTLVEMHEGAVEAKSDGLGRGSEFIVRLPLVARVADAAPADYQPQAAVPRSGRRVLIVDDNKDAALSLSMLLKLQGHEVFVAHDGYEALKVAPIYRPDLVLLDIGMPGIDGYEVARRMRQITELKGAVLAALTGWGQLEDRRRTADAGFDHHLVKPVEPSVLDDLLASIQTAAPV
jgi:CheY-like chemotaxis protein